MRDTAALGQLIRGEDSKFQTDCTLWRRFTGKNLKRSDILMNMIKSLNHEEICTTNDASLMKHLFDYNGNFIVVHEKKEGSCNVICHYLSV